MKAFGTLCAAFAAVYLIQVELALVNANASDLSNFPGCVAQNQDDVDGDILPNHLKYESIARKETDDPDLHSKFIERILEKTHNDDEYNDLFYVTFAVYYEHNKGVYKQFAAAILCRDKFKSAENKCRNRSYFFSPSSDQLK